MQYKAVDGLSLRACHLSVIQCRLRGMCHRLSGHLFRAQRPHFTHQHLSVPNLKEIIHLSTGNTRVLSSKELIVLIGDPSFDR